MFKQQYHNGSLSCHIIWYHIFYILTFVTFHVKPYLFHICNLDCCSYHQFYCCYICQLFIIIIIIHISAPSGQLAIVNTSFLYQTSSGFRHCGCQLFAHTFSLIFIYFSMKIKMKGTIFFGKMEKQNFLNFCFVNMNEKLTGYSKVTANYKFVDGYQFLRFSHLSFHFLIYFQRQL